MDTGQEQRWRSILEYFVLEWCGGGIQLPFFSPPLSLYGELVDW